jgi:cell division protein FtsB
VTGREQERRRRRGEPSGGSPSRRSDRVRRPADRTGTTDRSGSDTGHEPGTDGGDAAPRARATRGRGGPRTARRSLASRVLGRLTTRRAALLALVVCALALSVAVPLHTYLSQRNDLQAQLQQQAALRAQAGQLEQRESQLSDPAQVEAEARTRLHYVMPGETPYVVQLPGSVPVVGSSTPGQKTPPSTSWYQKLWNSIQGPP